MLNILQARAENRIGSFPQITFDLLSEYTVPIPTLKIQKGIAGILKLVDSKIENNNHISRELEAMAKTIYDYWFLQFDFPDENGRPYKSSGGEMVWNDELKRAIPVGWEVDIVKNFIEHINTGLNPRDNFKLGNGNIRYITVKNLTIDGTIDFSNCDVINESARAIVHRRSDVSKHDILFASIAPLGRCCIVQENPVDWDINESVFCIRPKLSKVSSPYLYQFFMSDEFVKRAEHSSTGSVFSGIRIGVLENMKLFIPTKKVMDKFTEAVSGALYMKYKLTCQNQELTSLRDFLLPLLMNGQVTIKNAIPSAARTTTDSLSYGMQLVFSALQQSDGYLPLNTLADMFAILGSSKEMQKMLPESDEKTAWSKNLPNLAINDPLLVETIDELIKWGLLGLRTVNGVRELLLIGDWPIDKVEDPWIEIDAMLAAQAIQNWDERLRVKNPLVLRFREILESKQYIAA